MGQHIAFSLLSLLWAQTIVTSEPTLVVCGSAGTFQVTVSNTTPNPLTGVQLQVVMPPGVAYQAGTVSAPATEVSATPPTSPTFGLPNLHPGQSITFTYQAQAGCDVIPFLADQNNEVKNTYQLTWSGGGSYTYTPSYEYTIQQPLLQYFSITNQTYTTATAPATFTRTFTVKNAGDGRLSLFRHSETAGTGLQILSSTGGTVISHTPHALTLEFNGTHFATVGNNDAYLDPNEVITFTVTYGIQACTDLGSNFALTWGCNSQTCQTVTQTGGAVVTASGTVPNMTLSGFAPNGNAIVFTQESSCYQDNPSGASKVLFRMTNTGTGTAYQTQVTLFISEYPSDVYAPHMPARIDTSSVVVRIGSTAHPRVITAASAGDPAACFSVSNRVKRFTLQVPPIAPGETLYVEFDHYVCGIEACHGFTRPNIRSIGWDVSYKSACNDLYTATGGSNYRAQFNAPLSNNHPGTVSDGQSFNICVTAQEEPGNWVEYFTGNYVNSGGSPSNTNYVFQWVFQLPPSVQYTGGPVQWVGTKWDDNTVTLTWPATSVNVSGSTVTVTFTHANRPAGWQTFFPTGSFKNSYVCLPVQVVCGAGGVSSVQTQILFNPNPTCNPNPFCYGMPQSSPISVNCPVVCPDGMEVTNFSFDRVSYGQPDNNNDGVPEAGSVNLSLIRRDRMMVTDTALGYFEGVIRASTFGSWQNAWAILELGAEGDRFIGLEAQVNIRKAAGPVYQATVPLLSSNACSGWPNCNRFAVDLRAATLISQGVVPPGFTWQPNDTVRVSVRTRFDINPGGFLGPMNVTPYFYTTPNPNPLNFSLDPHPAAQRYSCRSWSASMELVGYYFYTTDPVLYDVSGCDTLTLGLRQYLSIGPCCSNYCSGNLFPYEYRLWSLPTQMDVTLPTGWRYVPGSGYLVHQRTQGNASATSAACVNDLTTQTAPGTAEPVNPAATPLVFPLSSLFTVNGGPLLGSDDGFFGILFFKAVPSCAASVEVDEPVSYTVQFSGRLNGTQTSPALPNGVRIFYRGPRLQVEAITNPIVATQNVLEWYVKVSNVSNVANAPNSFLYFSSQHGQLSVVDVIDASTSTSIASTGGYYPIGTVAKGTDRYFYVRAQLSGCTQLDTLWARVGWDCAGYPPSVSTYACANSAPKDTLTYILGSPDLILSSSVTPNPSDLCDTLTVTLTVTNSGTAYGYNPSLFMILPSGMSYVLNSAEASTDGGVTWSPTIDPGVFFAVLRVWNLTTVVPPWANGMPHIAPNNQVQLRFKVTTTCSYISGAQIRFYALFRNLCNQPQYRISASPVVALTSVIVPYNTQITAPDVEVRGCTQTYTYTVDINNLGLGSTTTSDSVRVVIPSGIYVTGSTVGNLNFTTHEPQITTSGGNTILTWGLQGGHGVGESMSFTFQFQVHPSLPSGTYPLTVQTVINASRTCGSTTCNVFYSTGTQNATLTVVRPAGLWTGAVDRDWFKAFNWGDCQVPTCAVDVIIPDTINDPLISGGVASCHDITIQSAALLEIASTGQLDICRHYTLQAGATLQAASSSRVRFVGAVNQNYIRQGIGDWWHVDMAQSVAGQRLILFDDLIFDGTLTLTQGVIDGFTNGKETFARQAAAGAVTIGNVNSYISGLLRRNLNTAAIDGWYYLPVGDFPSGKGYELAQVLFDAPPAFPQLVAYFLPVAPTSTVTQTDCSGSFGGIPNLNHGYWVINRIGGAPTPYHIRVFSRNYTNATGVAYAVVKRPTGFGGNFGFEGVCEGAPYHQANQTGRLNVPDFSEFAVAQSPTPLAVQFIEVRAWGQVNGTQLRFRVRQDWNALLYHEIDRSEDGLSWQKVGQLAPEVYLAREGEVGAYSWTDGGVQRGNRYLYRVRAVERTGAQYLSPVVEAVIPELEELVARIIPNPSQEEAWLEVSQAGLPVRIWDAAGRLLWEGRTTEDRLALPASQLSAGVYVVEVGTLRLRWVKQ